MTYVFVMILRQVRVSRQPGRSLTAKYADVYHVRDHKLAEHWHLAFDPKADAAFMVG